MAVTAMALATLWNFLVADEKRLASPEGPEDPPDDADGAALEAPAALAPLNRVVDGNLVPVCAEGGKHEHEACVSHNGRGAQFARAPQPEYAAAAA